MNHIITAAGILFCCIGILFLVKPALITSVLDYLKQGRRMYLLVLIRLILGALFLLGADQSRIPWIIIVFGILIILKGLVAVVLGPERVKQQMEKVEKVSPSVVRLISLLTAALGALIIYSA